ncbi:MAG: ABC transporter permease [Thiomonas sp.]|uniref:ABC transporter permease n=1 Tax=Thiomonas sp. TaxID=2047785 RepID=UPI002A36BBC2|nr:ABC transporter permease [Thiomonas sp.]MDY0330458.1 ABC transporter permease [Thiomonas sp.]
MLLLIRRDMAARTSGTVLGSLWMLVQPTLQVAALWFLLDIVLKVRFPGMEGGFVGYYLTGMLPWLMMSEIIQRSLGVMPEYAALYQRSVFPLFLIPLVPLLVSGGIYVSIFFIVAFLISGWAGALGALLLMLGLLLWLLPFCYLLAVLGLFVRDLQQLAPFVLTMLMYVTPILYVPSALPQSMTWWLQVNPFAHLMALAHALVQGQAWTWWNLVVPGALWLVVLLPALALFYRAQPHMREAL